MFHVNTLAVLALFSFQSLNDVFYFYEVSRLQVFYSALTVQCRFSPARVPNITRATPRSCPFEFEDIYGLGDAYAGAWSVVSGSRGVLTKEATEYGTGVT